jgi:hypothetical protein
MRKSITVKLDDKTIAVEKLPLGKYADLLKALKELPKRIPGLTGKSNDMILQELPMLIGEALPDFINIITIAAPLTKEEVEQLGLDEVTRIVLAVVEVNNYQEVFDNIKKALARPAQPKKVI